MKLSAYLTHENVSPEQLAALIRKKKGKASVSGIVKWLRGERTPRPDQQRVIFEVTGGQVTPNDFVLERAP